MNKRFLLLIIALLAIYITASAQNDNKKVDPTVSLFQYGALGAIVIAGGWYILFLHKQHSRQIDQRDQVIKDQFNKMNEQFEKNATILTELKTLIQQDILIKRTEK